MSDIITIDQFETVENIEITVFPTYNEINVNKVSGAVTSVNGQIGDVVIETTDNNFTDVLKNKLDGIATGAEVNVNADWNATSGDAQILNKPTLSNGDMLKTTYDKDNSGVVDNAEAIIITGRNATGATLRRGTIVYIHGSTGNRPNFVKAQANSEATSAGIFGVITDDITNNADGNCCVIGFLDNLDTRTNATYPFTNDTLNDGDTIYLSPTTAGYITNVKPSAPNHLVYLGKVTRTSPTNGTIVYRVQNGYELEELHNVAISGETNNQLLCYESATSLWKNKSITTAEVSDSTGKRYQTENQNNFNDATSSIQTQLNNKQNSLGYTPFRSVITTQSIGSNVSGETQLIRVTIPANSFSADDKLRFRLFFSKVGTANACTLRVRISTSSTMPTGTTGQIALASIGATALYSPFERIMAINGGNLKGFAFTPAATTDNATSTSAISNVNFDVTQTQYLYVSVVPASITTDVTYLEFIEITD